LGYTFAVGVHNSKAGLCFRVSFLRLAHDRVKALRLNHYSKTNRDQLNQSISVIHYPGNMKDDKFAWKCGKILSNQ